MDNIIQIILSTYNGEHFIVDQLESIAKQNTKYGFEILIRDDGSTDNTVDLIQNTMQKFPTIKHQIEKGTNIGYMMSFIELMKKTTSKYILFADQDDIWHPEKIELFVNEFKKRESNSKYVTIYSEMNVFGKLKIENYYTLNNVKAYGDFSKHFFHTYIAACSIGVNANVKNLFLRLYDACKHPMSHDTPIIMIGILTDGLYKIETALFNYRIHDKNLCGLSIKKTSNLVVDIKTLLKYCIQNKEYHKLKIDDYYISICKSLWLINSNEKFIEKGRDEYLKLAINFTNKKYFVRKYLLLKYNFFPEEFLIKKMIRFFCL